MIDIVKKYFSFKGRLPRSEYIAFLVKLLILGLPYFIYIILDLRKYKAFNVMRFDQFLFNLFDQSIIYIFVNLLIIIFFIIIYLSSTVRRLHDIGLSGWVLLLGFLPSGGAIYMPLALIPGTKGHNKYGPDPLERERIPEQVKTI